VNGQTSGFLELESDPWITGQAKPKKGLPTTMTEPSFEEKIERLRAERNEWIEKMALQMGRNRVCLDKECMGMVYEWYGPLNIALPGVGFIAKPCSCARGRMWGEQKEQEANNAEVRRMRQDILRASGLPYEGAYKDFTLQTYQLTKNANAKWFKDFTEWHKDEWLSGPRKSGAILLGSYGVGKTGVAIGFGREVIDKLGVKVLYLNVADFVETISKAWVNKDNSDWAFLDRLKNRELLILNDLGAGHGTAKDWDDKSPMQHLFNVLDYRNTMQYPYVITTNCQSPKELLAVVGERNLNRILDTCKVFICTGANLRNKAS
jgi:DNA replication protein DnaC